MKRVISCQIAGLALDSPADDRMNYHSRELRHAIRGLVRVDHRDAPSAMRMPISALALAQLLRSQIRALGHVEVTTLLMTSMFVLAMSLVASWIPARRATRIDPVDALRFE